MLRVLLGAAALVAPATARNLQAAAPSKWVPNDFNWSPLTAGTTTQSDIVLPLDFDTTRCCIDAEGEPHACPDVKAEFVVSRPLVSPTEAQPVAEVVSSTQAITKVAVAMGVPTTTAVDGVVYLDNADDVKLTIRADETRDEVTNEILEAILLLTYEIVLPTATNPATAASALPANPAAAGAFLSGLPSDPVPEGASVDPVVTVTEIRTPIYPRTYTLPDADATLTKTAGGQISRTTFQVTWSGFAPQKLWLEDEEGTVIAFEEQTGRGQSGTLNLNWAWKSDCLVNPSCGTENSYPANTNCCNYAANPAIEVERKQPSLVTIKSCPPLRYNASGSSHITWVGELERLTTVCCMGDPSLNSGEDADGKPVATTAMPAGMGTQDDYMPTLTMNYNTFRWTATGTYGPNGTYVKDSEGNLLWWANAAAYNLNVALASRTFNTGNQALPYRNTDNGEFSNGNALNDNRVGAFPEYLEACAVIPASTGNVGYFNPICDVWDAKKVISENIEAENAGKAESALTAAMYVTTDTGVPMPIFGGDGPADDDDAHSDYTATYSMKDDVTPGNQGSCVLYVKATSPVAVTVDPVTGAEDFNYMKLSARNSLTIPLSTGLTNAKLYTCCNARFTNAGSVTCGTLYTQAVDIALLETYAKLARQGRVGECGENDPDCIDPETEANILSASCDHSLVAPGQWVLRGNRNCTCDTADDDADSNGWVCHSRNDKQLLKWSSNATTAATIGLAALSVFILIGFAILVQRQRNAPSEKYSSNAA